MKNTFLGFFSQGEEKLEDMTFKIFVYNGDKYTGEVTEEIEERYTGVKSWDIIEGGKEAFEIEESGLIDEHHEYLVLHFTSGETATFRNSHVDMFVE